MMFFANQADPTLYFINTAKAAYAGPERRVERRRRVLKGALMQFNNGYGSLECVLRDLNSNGARISMAQTSGIPTRFQLAIAGERTPIEALVRWRTNRDLGLSFLLRAD